MARLLSHLPLLTRASLMGAASQTSNPSTTAFNYTDEVDLVEKGDLRSSRGDDTRVG